MTTPTTPYIQNTASPYQVKGLPNWVWRSTDVSIKKTQFSVLAVIEIPLAILLYYWLASCLKQTSAWSQGAVIFYLFATPLLLLRSDTSVSLGKKWLQNYYDEQEKKELLLYEWGLLILLTGLLTFVVIKYLATHYLLGLCGGTSFWCEFSIGAISFAVALTSTSELAPSVILSGAHAFAGEGVVGVAFLISFVFAFGFTFEFVGAFASVGGISFAAVFSSAVLYLIEWKTKIAQAFLSPLFISWSIGVFIRTLLMRLAASLCELPSCLKNLRDNTRLQGFCVDAYHLPELMPQATEISDIFSARGLLAKLNSNPKENIVKFAIMGVLFFLTYFPAILYRFGLKSALWLWWPIFLLVPKMHESTQAKIDKNKMFEEPVAWRRVLFFIIGALLINLQFKFVSINISELFGVDLAKLITLDPKIIEFLSQFNFAYSLWSIVALMAWVVALYAIYPAYHWRIKLHPEKALNTFDFCRQLTIALSVIAVWCLLLQQPIIKDFVKLWWL